MRASPISAILRSAYDAVLSARQRQADNYIAGVRAVLDDAGPEAANPARRPAGS